MDQIFDVIRYCYKGTTRNSVVKSCIFQQRFKSFHVLEGNKLIISPFQELIKATPLDGPDRKSLEYAKDAMEDINAYINEMKRDDETCSLIREVEKSITDLIMVVLAVFYKKIQF